MYGEEHMSRNARAYWYHKIFDLYEVPLEIRKQLLTLIFDWPKGSQTDEIQSLIERNLIDLIWCLHEKKVICGIVFVKCEEISGVTIKLREDSWLELQ